MSGAIIVRGHPTDAELAALCGVLALVRQAALAASEPEPDRTDGWSSPRRQLRMPPVPGRGAWRAAVRG